MSKSIKIRYNDTISIFTSDVAGTAKVVVHQEIPTECGNCGTEFNADEVIEFSFKKDELAQFLIELTSVYLNMEE